MDVSLPDLSGIQLCKEVKELYVSVLVPGLGTFNREPIIRNMMENGASGH